MSVLWLVYTRGHRVRYGLFILEVDVIESGMVCLYSRSSSQVWFVYTRGHRVRYGGPLESWGRFSVGSGRGFRRHVGEKKVLYQLCATYPGTAYNRAIRELGAGPYCSSLYLVHLTVRHLFTQLAQCQISGHISPIFLLYKFTTPHFVSTPQGAAAKHGLYFNLKRFRALFCVLVR